MKHTDAAEKLYQAAKVFLRIADRDTVECNVLRDAIAEYEKTTKEAKEGLKLMHEQTTIDPAQTEVDRLWAKITELSQAQAAHEHEIQLVTQESDRLHRENQALRREIEALATDGFEAGCAFAMSTMRERAEKKAELLALFDEVVNRPCTVRPISTL